MAKNKKKKLSFRKIYLLIFTIITLLFIGFLAFIDVLPIKYFMLVVLFSIIIYLLIFIFIKKKKKLGYILSLIFILIYGIITYYLGITMNFFSTFNSNKYNEKTYLLIVLKENNYDEINDILDKNIGYSTNILDDIDKIQEKLEKEIKFNLNAYKDYNELFNELDEKEVDAILVLDSYYNIKMEEEETDIYQILYSINIRSEVTDNTKAADVVKEPFTIYISGIDVYGSIETVSRSDVNILMTVNPNTKQILLTTIPRDYYVQLAGTTGYKDKLTHAGTYGINMSIDTISQLLDIDINYYIRVNFSTLEKLIDAIGGVDVYSEYSFVSYIDNYQFYKGYNHMNGKQALAFSRERKSLPGGDNDRGKNQEAVIDGIIRKATSSDVIYKYNKILSSLKGTFQTNLADTEITKLIKNELKNPGGWNITSIALTGVGDLNYTYSYSNQKLYVTIPDSDSISDAKNMIEKVYNGEVLDASYDDDASNIKYPNQVTVYNNSNNTTKSEKKNEEVVEEDKNTENEDNNEEIVDDDENLLEEDNTLEDTEEETNEENEETNEENEETTEIEE